MNENGDCVAPASCSCYDSGKIIPAGDIISKDGGSWYVHGVGSISVEKSNCCRQGFSRHQYKTGYFYIKKKNYIRLTVKKIIIVDFNIAIAIRSIFLCVY